MATTLQLIKQAQTNNIIVSNILKNIRENISVFAKQNNVTSQGLSESITHVLAGLSQTSKTMHPNSVAALLAGVEKLAADLPGTEDITQKQNTLKLLSTASMKYEKLTAESLPNHSVVVIAQHGAKFPELVQKYTTMLASPDAPQQLDAVAKQLSASIERAMNKSATLNQDPASTGSTAGSATSHNPADSQ